MISSLPKGSGAHNWNKLSKTDKMSQWSDEPNEPTNEGGSTRFCASFPKLLPSHRAAATSRVFVATQLEFDEITTKLEFREKLSFFPSEALARVRESRQNGSRQSVCFSHMKQYALESFALSIFWLRGSPKENADYDTGIRSLTWLLAR